MSKKIILVFVGIFLFFVAHIACASVIINEVKYSPTTGQWVEIYNDTDSDVDITAYRILDSGASTNGHAIVAVPGGSNFIPKHSFGVVAKVPSDFGAVSHPLFKSSLNIKVSSDTVILKDESGGTTSSVNIDGTALDGNSFQLIDGSWKVAVPTPGSSNDVSPVVLSQSGGSSGGVPLNTTTGTDDTSTTKTKVVEIPQIKTKIISKNLAFVNLPLDFQANNIGYSGETLYYGKNFWNFGDGDSKDQINKFDKFTHVYSYPGEYVVSLEYYINPYGEIPDAASQIIINVVPLDVVISKTGDEKDFFIEITNNSDYDVDLSNWVLSSANKNFILPKNTIIESKGKITLSPKITGFSSLDENNLKLLTATRGLVYDYESSNVVMPVQMQNDTKNTVVSMEKLNVSKGTFGNTKTKLDLASTEVDAQNQNEDLQATAFKNTSNDERDSFWFFVGFVILLIVSSGVVYFIRRKKKVLKAGDDFEILDE